MDHKAKKEGSKLKSRIIPEQSIVKWSQIIDEMEDQYSAVTREERFHFISFKEVAIHALIYLRFLGAFREERDQRKAEVEFAKIGSFASCF